VGNTEEQSMSASFVYCATCGAANPPDAVSCFACGNPPLAAPPGANPGSGILLKQRYRLLAQIGKGGFGAVYRAEDTELGDRKVAIKEMSQRGLAPEELQEAMQNFRQEALLLAGLTHPNLPRIYEQFSEGGHWYLVMDFIEGETLETHLNQAPGGRLPVPEVLKIAIQLCTVLDYLHTRQPPIIFRDLKPANIMLAPGGHLYLIDFGIARHFKPGQTRDTVAFGSAGYAAPEQYGKAQTTTRSDIYSLGATLHHLLSGHDPSDTPFVFAPLHLAEPAGLEALIMQMLEADQTKRPASMALIQHDLERMAGELAAGHQPRTPHAAPAGAPTRNPLHPLRVYHGHTGRVNTIAWSPDGKYLASGGNDQTIQIWGSATGKKTWTFPKAGQVRTLAWSPDGKQLAWVSGGNEIELWDADTGEFRRITHHHIGFLRGLLALAWSPDGSCLAAGGKRKTVEIWEAKTGKHLLTYNGHKRFLEDYPVYAIAWSPNGEWIASASTDTSIQVWEATTCNLRCAYNGYQYGYSGGVAWSPDGKHLASAGDKAIVHIWDAATGRKHLLLSGHKGAVNAVAWSPDGKHVASGGSDQTVRVWGVVTGKELHTYSHYQGEVRALAWSPDSTRLASAGDDHTVKIWQVG
jgi:tRNA A-37 threonylcarbamoyl transferase component Bud32